MRDFDFNLFTWFFNYLQFVCKGFSCVLMPLLAYVKLLFQIPFLLFKTISKQLNLVTFSHIEFSVLKFCPLCVVGYGRAQGKMLFSGSLTHWNIVMFSSGDKPCKEFIFAFLEFFIIIEKTVEKVEEKVTVLHRRRFQAIYPV